jgi:UDP-4-amino-4,6-dideoxy-N-acetyl-beta-L-altrosamine N-acetyltransferase
MPSSQDIQWLRSDFVVGGVALRNFSNLDRATSLSVLEMRNHVEIRTWMNSSDPIAFEEHTAFTDRLLHDQTKLYYLVSDRRKRDLGVISLVNIDLRNRHAYLGIYRNPDRLVHGAGSLCMRVLLYHSFETIKLHALYLQVIATNKRAIGFYKRFGFETEGSLREYVYRDGTWTDMVVMRMLQGSYLAKKTVGEYESL